MLFFVVKGFISIFKVYDWHFSIYENYMISIFGQPGKETLPKLSHSIFYSSDLASVCVVVQTFFFIKMNLQIHFVGGTFAIITICSIGFHSIYSLLYLWLVFVIY